MTTTEVTSTIEETTNACFICKKDLSGILVNLNKLAYLAGPLSEKKIASVGVVCDHCGTRYCDAHKKELHNGFLMGYTKSTCLKCGQLIGGSQ